MLRVACVLAERAAMRLDFAESEVSLESESAKLYLAPPKEESVPAILLVLKEASATYRGDLQS